MGSTLNLGETGRGRLPEEATGERRGGTQSLAKATAHGKPRGEQSHHPLGGGEEAPGA